jgi:uncharacterized protein
VQHALRAFTPQDQKAVRAAAQTFRTNPKLNVETVITQLGVGEGLVSFLDDKGIPGVVERALLYPPHSQIGPVTAEQRQQIVRGSVVFGVYEKTVDRESAYERLKGKPRSPRRPVAVRLRLSPTNPGMKICPPWAFPPASGVEVDAETR